MKYEKLYNKIIEIVSEINKGTPRRINHFLSVYEKALEIAQTLNLSERDLHILSLASLMHDIGIKTCEEKYNSSAGYLQEIEGPSIAGEILEEFKVEEDVIDRVCFLISKHHTTKDVVGIDWQILLEADFLINAVEENYSIKQIKSYGENVFKTKKGKELLKELLVSKISN